MGGMFETKSDKASRKLARTKKEEEAKKKTRIVTITIISLLVLISAAAIFINSSFIRRTVPVVTIDGIGFTTAEFEFFFNTQYIEYINMMSQFQGISSSLPNSRRPLSTQVYNHETGETWADYFTSIALSRMSALATLHNAATAAGFTLPDEAFDEIEMDMQMIGFQAMMDGFPSMESFLQQLFGNSINEKTYRNIQEFIMTATKYSEHIRESFTYTSDELTGFYNENKDSLDVFNFRSFSITHEDIGTMGFENETEYEAALEEAIMEARLKANLYISEGFETTEDFIKAAQSEAGNTASWVGAVQNRMGENLDATFEDWLRDEARAYGDVTAFDNNTGSTILYFVSREDNSYHTTAMRQILILRESVDPDVFSEGTLDPAYLTAFEFSDTEARERAELVNSLFIAAGSTEDALLALMAEHSDDNTEGGFYENITKFSYSSPFFGTMKVVPEIEEWLFAEARKQGDSELVYTRDYGYHLLYFMGFGDPFYQLIAADRMRTRDHEEWMEDLPHGLPVKHASFILVHV